MRTFPFTAFCNLFKFGRQALDSFTQRFNVDGKLVWRR